MEESLANCWLDQKPLEVQSGGLLRQFYALNIHVYGFVCRGAGRHAKWHGNAGLAMRRIGLQQAH